MTNALDFSFFLEPPELHIPGLLTIEALAPLSIVASQPGEYYRSQAAPSEAMIYGLLENALGWHLGEVRSRGATTREKLFSTLRAQALELYGQESSPWQDSPWLQEKPDARASGVGFWSFLQYHVRFELRDLPAVERYEDVWSQHLRDTGRNFFGGSRTQDYRLRGLVRRTQAEDPTQDPKRGSKKRPPYVEMGEGKEKYPVAGLEDAHRFERGRMHYTSIRSAFPQYYVSPKKREYVIPDGPYHFRVRTTSTVSEMIGRALLDPAAPLYLGTNDGWVEATWKVLS